MGHIRHKPPQTRRPQPCQPIFPGPWALPHRRYEGPKIWNPLTLSKMSDEVHTGASLESQRVSVAPMRRSDSDRTTGTNAVCGYSKGLHRPMIRKKNRPEKSALPRRSATTLSLVGIALFIQPLAPSQADNWFGVPLNPVEGACTAHLTGQTITDNKTIVSGYVDASTELRDALLYTRTVQAQHSSTNNTYLETSNVGTAVTSTTDIVAHDRYYTGFCEDRMPQRWTEDGIGGLHGMASCKTLNSAKRCERKDIRVSNFTLNRSTQQARVLVCHEYGHGIGLSHRNVGDTCMESPPIGLNLDPSYSGHDEWHFRADWSA